MFQGRAGRFEQARKVERIYQCNPDSEFRDATAEKQNHTMWKMQTVHMRRSAPDFPASWKVGLTYLKEKLALDTIFSLPNLLFEAAEAIQPDEEIDFSKIPDPWDSTISVSSVPRHAFSWADLNVVQFFEVVNQFPERRKNVKISTP